MIDSSVVSHQAPQPLDDEEAAFMNAKLDEKIEMEQRIKKYESEVRFPSLQDFPLGLHHLTNDLFFISLHAARCLEYSCIPKRAHSPGSICSQEGPKHYDP